MTKLSERVERLEGPDREIDAEIMFDLYAKPYGVSKKDGGPRGYLWPEDNPSWSFGIRFPDRNRGWFAEQRRAGDGERLLIERDGALVLMNDLRVPPLTASLDAAMSLVPEGCLWTMDSWSARGWSAGIWRPRTRSWLINTDRDRQSPTPAIALCAAALKARGL
jgi:hypothetical protein